MSALRDKPQTHAVSTWHQLRAESKSLFAAALSVGIIGALSAMVGGALCPVCLVVAPSLLGVGAYKRWKASRAIQ